MPKLYAHPDGLYIGGMCAPRDFRTRAELLNDDWRKYAKVRKGELHCSYCGQRLWATSGAFHVLRWRGDAHYREENVLATFQTRRVAERDAEKRGTEYVVRAW